MPFKIVNLGRFWSLYYKNILENILDPPEKIIREYCENLRTHFFQLEMILLKYFTNDLMDYKKEIENLVENFLTLEESANKTCVFVTVFQYLQAHKVPLKTIIQVFLEL